MNLLEAATEVTKKSNFDNWFGKSVLHTSGVPHQFYHGTASDISTFSHDHTGSGTDQLGSGFYFTNKPEVGSHYANKTGTENGQNVIPVHLRATKPIYTSSDTPFTRTHIIKMITSAPNHKDTLQNFGEVTPKEYNKTLSGAVDAYTDIPKHKAIHTLSNDFYQNSHKEFLTNLTKHTGHDSVIEKQPDGHVIVNVFHPNQIKSSMGNVGSYSKKSDKITESTK